MVLDRRTSYLTILSAADKIIYLMKVHLFIRIKLIDTNFAVIVVKIIDLCKESGGVLIRQIDEFFYHQIIIIVYTPETDSGPVSKDQL